MLTRDPIDVAAENWARTGWADAADGMAVVTSVMRVQQLVLADVERELKPFGLTFARYEVLMLLRFSRRGVAAGGQGRRAPAGAPGERHQRRRPARARGARPPLAPPEPTDAACWSRSPRRGSAGAEEATAAVNRVFARLPISTAEAAQLYALLQRRPPQLRRLR